MPHYYNVLNMATVTEHINVLYKQFFDIEYEHI